jgi:flagellar basal body-associated protein FliL
MNRVAGLGAKSGKIKVIILLVAAMVIGGGVSFFVFGRSKGDDKADSKGKHGEKGDKKGKDGKSGGDEEVTPPEFIDMGSFVVNLGADGDLRYLKASVTLAVRKRPVDEEDEKKKKKGEGEGEGEGKKGPPTLPPADDGRARDVIVRILSDQQFATIREGPARQKVKDALVVELNKVMAEYEVVEVLFTSFVMQ